MPSTRSRRRRGVTYVEVLLAVVLVLLLGTYVLAFQNVAAERERRLRCAMHLRDIAQALLMYANDNKGAYPRTRYSPEDDSTLTQFTGVMAADPFGKGGPEVNDVTASLFLLVRTGEFSPHLFLCPSVQARRGAQGVPLAPPQRDLLTRQLKPLEFPPARWDPLKRSNFAGPDELNYSVAIPYPSRSAVLRGYKFNSAVVADFAILADANPGGPALTAPPKPGARLTTTRPGSPTSQMVMEPQANSRNHDREGQNVLFNDGHVEWFATPRAGANQDNIYTAGKAGQEVLGGQPQSHLDTVLVPVFDESQK